MHRHAGIASHPPICALRVAAFVLALALGECQEIHEEVIMKTNPFHSKLPGTDVHHNNTSCTTGNNIESYNKVAGTGGLPLCGQCSRL